MPLHATTGSGGDPGAADAPPPASAAASPRVSEPSTALLLAWFATGNRSLFAAQCLVEALVELYREGRSFEELQLSIKLATRSGGGEAKGGQQAAAGAEDKAEEGAEARVPLLQPQDEDVLVSWVALVFLTLEELGVRRDRAGEPVGARRGGAGGVPSGAVSGAAGAAGPGGVSGRSAYLAGMLGYVRQTLGLYEEGQTLARVAGLQGLVRQSSGAASSPFLLLMQQYTRLVLLTVEVVAAAGLPTARPLRDPDTVTRPSGYSHAFAPACSGGGGALAGPEGDGGGGDGGDGAVCSPRGLAVRLLMAFMGAVLGSRWSLGKFVEGVRVAYAQGQAADELFSELDEQEFLQSGGLLPIASQPAPGPPAPSDGVGDGPPATTPAGTLPGGDAPSAAGGGGAAEAAAPQPTPQHVITKKLLSNWISLSYMTLAQLAVRYPAAGQRLGWAWAGFGDPTEALGMNDFVGNVLRQMAGADPRVIPQQQEQPQQQQQPGESPAAQAMQAQWKSEAELQAQAGAGVEADSSGHRAAEAQGAGVGAASPGGRRRGGDAPLVRVEDESLQTTSTAFQVLSQQVALVQAVCRNVMGF